MSPEKSTPKQKRSGGQVLVDGLIANGVKHVFCVPGESYLAALDAFYERQQQIQLIACRQEGGAAYMAEAYGKLSGEPGICFASRGPGASNAMIGIHTAFQDSTPVLLFIGQIPRHQRGREAFQELEYQQVYRAVAKAVFTIDDAATIPQQLFEAWEIAISDRPGPVVVELPEDMLTDEVEVADREKPIREVVCPTDSLIRQCSELLEQSASPVIICGGAAWNAKTTQLLIKFSEKHDIPVACAFRRQHMFDNTHPHYIGDLNTVPNPQLVETIKNSDLVIALAARLGEITTCGYTLFDVPEFDTHGKRKLIHVFPSASELNSVYRADLALACDAETFLQAMDKTDKTTSATNNATKNATRKTTIKSARQSYLQHIQLPRDENEPIRMDKIMEWLRARLPSDAVITMGAGNYTIWAQRNYQYRQPYTQLASTNGSMGYGVASGIAGKILRPNSIVVSFSGDGCFLMNGQELATAVQYGINVIFIVINNRRYGTIRSHQERRFPGRPIATDLENPDFAALARAYRAFGISISHTDEFESAFEQAIRANCPAVIEINTNH